MGMLKTLALGVVGYGLYASWRHHNGLIRDAALKPTPPLQRWEGEGGNVPDANPALQADAPDREGVAPETSSARGH